MALPGFFRISVGLLACLAALAGARSAAAAAEAQRIISLAPSATEAIFALGFGDRVVGVSSYCDYPPEVARIDRVGTFLSPNLERIVAKRPDVIVAVPTPGNQATVEALERLGLKVVVVDPETVADIEAALVTIARALGDEAAGPALVARIEARMQAVRERVAAAPRRRVLMVVGHTPLIAVGRGSYLGELIQSAQGTNVAADVGGAWPHLSLEFAIAAAPEVIIDTTMGNEEWAGSAAHRFWDVFPTVPAVREGRVYAHKADQLLRPGPRIAEAFETVARLIHPERFAAEAPPPGATARPVP